MLRTVRCNILARKSAKLIANFRETMVTSPVSLSLSLSLSHRAHLTHNIGSASALPIMALQYTQSNPLPKVHGTPVCHCENLNSERVLFHYNTEIHELQKLNWSFCPSPSSLIETLCSKVKKKKNTKTNSLFICFTTLNFTAPKLGQCPGDKPPEDQPNFGVVKLGVVTR